jgi:hypothetical protein
MENNPFDYYSQLLRRLQEQQQMLSMPHLWLDPSLPTFTAHWTTEPREPREWVLTEADKVFLRVQGINPEEV